MKNQPIPKSYRENQKFRQAFPDKVFELGTLLTLAPRECITYQGYPVDTMYYLLSGIVKSYSTSEDGKTMIYAFLKSGETLGDIEFFTNCETLGTTLAVTTVECIVLDVVKYRDRLMNDVDFLQNSIANLGLKLVKSARNHTINLLQPVHVRVASYVIAVAQDGIFQSSITDMAELIGASYRHVWRVLQGFCADGFLEKSGHAYRVMDKDGLERLASEVYAL